MNTIDYILLGGVVLALAGVIVHLIERKKAGKGRCDYGCANCPSAGACQRKKENTDE